MNKLEKAKKELEQYFEAQEKACTEEAEIIRRQELENRKIQICENCRWWSALEDSEKGGFCMFNPPRERFPSVRRTDFCRKWTK